MTYALAAAMLDIVPVVPVTGSTGTTIPGDMLQTAERKQQLAIERDILAARVRTAARQGIYVISPDIVAFQQSSDRLFPGINTEHTTSQQIFEAIQALYLSSNRPRDRQIAERITALHRDAIAEDERILPDSLAQFKDFFLDHPDLGLPKITLTPDGTLRARWIHGPGNFVAIEFTGEPLAKLVAEIPGALGVRPWGSWGQT